MSDTCHIRVVTAPDVAKDSIGHHTCGNCGRRLDEHAWSTSNLLPPGETFVIDEKPLMPPSDR